LGADPKRYVYKVLQKGVRVKGEGGHDCITNMNARLHNPPFKLHQAARLPVSFALDNVIRLFIYKTEDPSLKNLWEYRQKQVH